ncbi:MAG: helix-turn-helix domain-containing protein [Steroidobacteraceae bacterium]
MSHKKQSRMQCPVARSLDVIGEWWSMLILRDAFLGLRRFDEFQDSLGIAPNMLSRRLAKLVSSGLLERRQYGSHSRRFEYVLTQRGRDFRPVLLSLMDWGNRHLAPEGRSVLLVDTTTGREVHPLLIDAVSGKPLSDPRFRAVAGPAANARQKARYAPQGRAYDGHTQEEAAR